MSKTLTIGFLTAVALTLGVYFSRSPGVPAAKGTVYLDYSTDGGYRLVRNGAPFRVSGAAGANHLSYLKASGANTVRVYAPGRLAEVLDSAAALGLAVVADLPLPKYYPEHPHFTGYASVQEVIDSVLPIVRQYRNHPALLFWMVGNEIFEQGYSRSYLRAYDRLLTAIRAVDPNHPLSTALIRRQLGEMRTSYKEPAVDFVSINMFGNLDNFELYKRIYYPVWRGPYLISEWGQDGYWETATTNWGAPIEPSSYFAAREITERYREHIRAVDDGRSLGELAFYWGNKFERTSSWFSTFSIAGVPTEKCHRLAKIWGGDSSRYTGSRPEYLLLNDLGPQDNVVLTAGDRAGIAVVLAGDPPAGLRTEWTLRREQWNDYDAHFGRYDAVDTDWVAYGERATAFGVPTEAGPYRLYCTIGDSSGYAATVNFPFYVIAAPDA